MVLGSMSMSLGQDSISSMMYFSVSGLFFSLLVAHQLVRYPRLWDGCKNKAKSDVSRGSVELEVVLHATKHHSLIWHPGPQPAPNQSDKK